MASYDVVCNIWQAFIEGNSRVTDNTAPLGGGVYLLGEKARLETGGAAVVTNNFAGVDPDISTRGTVGTWADICLDGTMCAEFSCGTDRDGPTGPLPVCGDASTGQFSLLGCSAAGYVEFSSPPECVEVPAGSLLSRDPSSGVLTRNSFVCPFGTFNLVAGNGHSLNYSAVCQECPEMALCVGGANAPECLPGTYSIGSGQGLTIVVFFSSTCAVLSLTPLIESLKGVLKLRCRKGNDYSKALAPGTT